ncbi:TIGR02449 family protein [Zooshikella ganghwensis]
MTLFIRQSIVTADITANLKAMDEQLNLMLHHKIDELLALCQELLEENQTLKASEQAWREERAQLVEKNELARSKVEAMISRLKALEQES